jgi:hypothetical protein
MAARPDPTPHMSISWRKAFLLNERNMVIVAAWAREHTEGSIKQMFAQADPKVATSRSRRRHYQRRMNREDTRAVLHVLARPALKSEGVDNPSMSITELSSAIDRTRLQSMVKTLKTIILPTLSDAGYISGFIKRPTGSTEAYKVTITITGIEAHKRYLARCAEYCAPYDDELRDLGE